jgi:hypothetical protein
MALARELCGRSPDAIAAAKKLFQDTWVSSEEECLDLETTLQKKLLLSWNQVCDSLTIIRLSMILSSPY